MISLLDKIPEKSWIILAYCLGIGFCFLCAAAGIIIVRSSNITYSDRDTQINLSSDRVKEISNDVEYANNQLEQKLQELEEQVDRLQREEAQPLAEAIKQLKPVAKEIEKSNEELKEISN
jgi:TolA-binding protein